MIAQKTEDERQTLISFRVPTNVAEQAKSAARKELLTPAAFARRALLRDLEEGMSA